jgi:hypothetical protein
VLRYVICLVGLSLVGSRVLAQQPAPAGMSLAEAASRRFPEPVLVGSLAGRWKASPHSAGCAAWCAWPAVK